MERFGAAAVSRSRHLPGRNLLRKSLQIKGSEILALKQAAYLPACRSIDHQAARLGDALQAGDTFRECAGCPEMVVIPPGEFLMGSAESENVQGEIQKKLDIIANEVLIEANEWGGHLAAMASEEMEGIYVVPNRFPQGEYLLLFDPLDGSSNIDVNVSIGTISGLNAKAV